MKRKSGTLAIVIALFFLSAWTWGQGHDVTGVWDMTVETPNGTGNPSLSLKQEGEVLTGQYEGRMGGGRVSGNLKGNEIHMTVTMNFDEMEFTIVFSGTVEGDGMKGQADFGEYGGGAWSAKRRK